VDQSSDRCWIYHSLHRYFPVIFTLTSPVIDVGGAPQGGYLGAHTYHQPGPLANGWKGICSVFVTAAFSFAGVELVGLAAAECENPRKAIPRAVKQVFWGVSIFYMASLLMIGLIVPYNDPRLLNNHDSNHKFDPSASPFVIAIEQAGIKVIPSILNTVILISIVSIGNCGTYASTRTITGLAEIGQAPEIFKYIDKKGRLLMAILLASSFGLLAYINILPVGAHVFNWLVALSGLSLLFTWYEIS
jgi:yeast amino acid transporter